MARVGAYGYEGSSYLLALKSQKGHTQSFRSVGFFRVVHTELQCDQGPSQRVAHTSARLAARSCGSAVGTQLSTAAQLLGSRGASTVEGHHAAPTSLE